MAPNEFGVGSEVAVLATKALGGKKAAQVFGEEAKKKFLVGKVTGRDSRSRLVKFPEFGEMKIASRLLHPMLVRADGSKAVDERFHERKQHKKKKGQRGLRQPAPKPVTEPSKMFDTFLSDSSSESSSSSSSELDSDFSSSSVARKKGKAAKKRARSRTTSSTELRMTNVRRTGTDSSVSRELQASQNVLQVSNSQRTLLPEEEDDGDSLMDSQATFDHISCDVDVVENSQVRDPNHSTVQTIHSIEESQNEDSMVVVETSGVEARSSARRTSSSESRRGVPSRQGQPVAGTSSSSSHQGQPVAGTSSNSTSVVVNKVLWRVASRPIDNRLGERRPPTIDRMGWEKGGSALDLFRQFFLRGTYLDNFIKHTNQRLIDTQRSAPLKGIGELFTFFGLLLSAAKFRFVSKERIWTAKQDSMINGEFFRKRMSLSRFTKIFSSIAFVDKELDPRTNPAVPSMRALHLPDGDIVNYRTWDAIQPLIDGFNASAQAAISPGNGLCLDECMSKWLGKGDMYADGMPHVQKVIRKPVPIGAEIIAVACSETGILLNLELVDSRFAPSETKGSTGLKGAEHLLRMTEPWKGSGRTVYADSGFASVPGAVELKKQNGLYFIGVVKTATKMFPKKFINQFDYPHRGASVSLEAQVQDVPVFATGWTDYTTKGFVSTCGTTLPGKPRTRVLFENVGNKSHQNEVEEIPRDKTVAEYLDGACAIDIHNRFRQGYLGLEETVRTRIWLTRLFKTILGMVVTNAFLAYRFFKLGEDELPFESFREMLVEELFAFNQENIPPVPQPGVPGVHHEVWTIKKLVESLPPNSLQKEDGGERKSRTMRCRDCLLRGNKRRQHGRRCCITCSTIPDNRPVKGSDVYALCSTCYVFHEHYGKPAVNSL